MGILGQKSKGVSQNKADDVNNIKLIERPRICGIDLSAETISTLKKNGLNVYPGTLGNKVKVPNLFKNQNHKLLLDYDFPKNLHEYDIIIIDLDNFKTIDYDVKKNTRDEHTGTSYAALLSSFPETLFDPRPMNSFFLNSELQKISNREFFVLVFSSKDYIVKYNPFTIGDDGYAKLLGEQRYSIYSFWNDIQMADQKFGKEIFVVKGKNDLQLLLEKYLLNSEYNQTFYHPQKWVANERVKDDHFLPLMSNLNNDIVSYFEMDHHRNLIMLPQIQDKTNFILEFLTNVAPSIFPTLFPYSEKSSWKNDSDYFLPEHLNFIEKKKNVEKEFQEKLIKCDEIITSNLLKYSFLHDILSESGDDLTSAVIKYLEWLGFNEVKDFDQTKVDTSVLEEDIQVGIKNGLLIIECKGIGGTSTDADCSQISKIKHRRCKERKAFDVFALYIVNHQRYLPPLNRVNPPFTENQKQDAINDERGILTTWQLYNLYFDIENSILTKEEAKNIILEFGLIDFKPRDLNFIYEPTEIFKAGKVCIIKIDGLNIKIGDALLVEKNGKFSKNKIIGIRQNEKDVQESSKGELGIELRDKILFKSKIWKK